MKNILSYQQPISGAEIKKWIRYHQENQTSHTKQANKMSRFLATLKDNRMYKVAFADTCCGRCSYWGMRKLSTKPIFERI